MTAPWAAESCLSDQSDFQVAEEDRMTSRMVVSFASVLALGTVLSCASAPPKESNVSGSGESAERSDSSGNVAEERGSSAYDDAAATASANTCEDRPCFSNSACCAGASCGFDPERSHVQRYCLGL